MAARRAPRSHPESATFWPAHALFALSNVLCWLLVIAMPAPAATVFGAAEGLPSTLVQAIALAPYGHLWVGTQDGLSSFDGHRFEPLALTQAGQVPDEHAYRLLIDREYMLVATPSRLLRVTLASRRLQVLTAVGADLPEVQALWRDEIGGIWLGDATGRLFRMASISAEPRPVPVEGVTTVPAISGITGNAELIWLSTASGVLQFDRQTRQAVLLQPKLDEFVASDPYVQSIFLDAQDRLWIGMWNDGLLRLDRKSEQWTWFHPSRHPESGLSATSIWGIAGHAGQIHVATNRGIDVFDERLQAFQRLSYPDWDKVDGNGVIVTKIASDQAGLWAGVWGRGLVRFNAGDRFFERQVPMDEHPESLAHPMVYALHVDRDNRLWVGSYGAFAQWVDRQDRQRGERWHLQSLPRSMLRTESRYVWAMTEFGDQLAIGTGYGLFAARQGSVQILNPDLQSTRSLLQDANGDLLVGGVRGLFRWNGQRLDRIPLPDAMPSAAIHCMLRHRGELWLGGLKGVTRLDADFQVLEVHRVGNQASMLPGPVVWAMKEAADGVVWVGTSGGLVAIRGQGAHVQLERHLWSEQRADRSIGSIEFAEPSVLWLGTPRGLLRYRADTGEVRRFDARDGLISEQFHHGASASDGERLYFGSAGGVIAMDPRQLPEQSPRLHPSVVKIKVGRQDWQQPSDLLRLPDQPPSLQLQLSAFQFERPERVRFAYRWLPDDSQFSDLGDAHQAVFSDLPSGERTLELRAELDGFAVSRSVLRLQVAYAWYETWWGRLLIGLVTLASMVVFFLRRVQGIRANAEALRLEVQARTRALQRTSAELAAANIRLKEQVETDALTGIPNRHAVLERIAHWHAQGRPLGVLLIDLDFFKRINDAHGHLVGDQVLVQFATTLTGSLPEFICARFGGEEFFAFRETDDLQHLLARAHQMRAAVHDLVVTGEPGRGVRVTVSVGAAVLRDGESVTDLIRRADAAMYRAKAQGRDRIEAG